MTNQAGHNITLIFFGQNILKLKIPDNQQKS